MKGFFQGVVLLAAALIIQILCSHRAPWVQRSVDLVLLVVVFYGSRGARVGAMLAGAAGGLLQDVWFGDIRGLHGLIKTVIAYVLGGLGARFDLTSPTARLVAVLLATVMEIFVQPLVQLGLGAPFTRPAPADLLWRATGNMLVGAVLFSLAGKRPGKRKRMVAAA